MKRIMLVLVVVVVGCTVTDRRPDTYLNPEVTDRPTKFVLFNAGIYEGELTLALAKQGFHVKPIAMRGIVTELETPTQIIEYKKAGFQFGIQLTMEEEYGKQCVFSGKHALIVTMTVIDISTNETIAIIKQEGPNGECPPLTPVWTLLAQDLKHTWEPTAAK